MKDKILILGWGYPPNIEGGLDIHVKHLFEELLKKEVDVDLALPEKNAPDKDNIVQLKSEEGDMLWKARKMSSEVASLAEDYDIIHTHDWFGAEAGFKGQKHSDCKWISTMHSLASGRSRESGGEVTELEEVAVNEPDEAVAVSHKLSEETDEEYGRKPKVIHNGFSTPENSDRDIKKDQSIDGDMIFFVGRHAEQKGIEHLIYGFKKYLEEQEATLVIGGNGKLTESLKKFTEMLKIEEKIVFTGFIPSEELGDYYSSADLFVSPSINEPFGLTITEALDSGTPVLATENGVSELVDDKFILETEPNSDSIAEGIKEGLEMENGCEVEERSWEEMAEEILELYRAL